MEIQALHPVFPERSNKSRLAGVDFALCLDGNSPQVQNNRICRLGNSGYVKSKLVFPVV